MIADNDLDYFAIRNINDMERGFQTNTNGDLLVYIDRAENAYPSHPYLMKISHDTTDLVVSEIIKTYPEQNSADANTLKTVLDDAIKTSSKTYTSKGIVLWSHGSAWLPSGTSLYSNRGNIVDSVKSSSTLKSFGIDTKFQANSVSIHEMDIKDMANVLNGYDLEFILFDACFMATIEVAYELRNTNKYFIASPVEILSSGFPYKTTVPLFFDEVINPDLIAKNYYDYYSNQHGVLKSGAISVIKSSELDNLATSVNELCNKIGVLSLDSHNNILNIDSLQQFDRLKVGVLFDLKQFLYIESSNLNDFLLLNKINNTLNNTIISEYHTRNVLGSLPLNNCNGLSTFLPHKTSINVYDYYKTLSWYKASGYNKAFFDNY